MGLNPSLGAYGIAGPDSSPLARQQANHPTIPAIPYTANRCPISPKYTRCSTIKISWSAGVRRLVHRSYLRTDDKLIF